jgi:hypothetical protein
VSSAARFAWAFPLVGLALAFAGCPEEPLETLCDPGTEIFCRCKGGDPGTKTCDSAGQAFAECGPCEPRDEPVGAGGSPGTTTTGGNEGGGAPLMRACAGPEECESGLCEFGYCTINCTKVSDCDSPAAECVPFAGKTVCMPSCETAVDCETYGAPPSGCGYAPAIDNWDVTVCSNWEAQHALVPDGTDCAPLSHVECNLGYLGRSKVCSAEGVCATGCFTDADCTTDQECDGSGSALGQCK